jgi:hypothetical protein
MKDKTIIWVIVSFSLGIFNQRVFSYTFAGGTGEPNSPYQIATVSQLVCIGVDTNLLDKHFLLVADIDLDPKLAGNKVFDRAIIAWDIKPLPLFGDPGFTGKFDGDHHR